MDVAEAEQVTSRIRQWVKAFPVADVLRAFEGRAWLALGYESWDEWCDCELDGFKLPALQRKEVVAALAEAGMSNRAIANVVGASEGTVRNDRAESTAQNYAVERTTLGQDGKKRRQPRPAPGSPERASEEAEFIHDEDTYIPPDRTASEHLANINNLTMKLHNAKRVLLDALKITQDLHQYDASVEAAIAGYVPTMREILIAIESTAMGTDMDAALADLLAAEDN